MTGPKLTEGQIRMLWPTVVIDDDGYPTDESIDLLRMADIKDGAWLIEALPEIAAQIGYCSCSVADGKTILGDDATIVEFHTGGWSGAEDLIEAALSNLMLNAMFYVQWQRGGHYRFEVPISTMWFPHPKPDGIEARRAGEGEGG